MSNGWVEAHNHLNADPVMRQIIKKAGDCKLSRRTDYFPFLCKAVFNQQLSGKIARLLYGRFAAHFPKKKPTPPRAIGLLSQRGDRFRRACGLSKQKQKYLLDLARHFNDGRIPTRRLASMTDDQIIESLTAVHGIGRWTAEMFLIFVLNRPDVWPVDDLGVREAFKRAYKLPSRLKPKELTNRAEHWRPYRSVATWYLWRSLD